MAPHTIAGSHPRRDVPPRRDRPRPTWRSILEALGRTVYDPGKHLRQGETLPAPDKTKQRLGRYIEDALPGIPNEELRGLANKTIEVAQQVKHRHTPTRREAGIAADAVILPGQHASAT